MLVFSEIQNLANPINWKGDVVIDSFGAKITTTKRLIHENEEKTTIFVKSEFPPLTWGVVVQPQQNGQQFDENKYYINGKPVNVNRYLAQKRKLGY